jgi:hypothetical protein
MTRARGANARLRASSRPFTAPRRAATIFQMPFVSSNIGPEQGLIESDLLGQGREGSTRRWTS